MEKMSESWDQAFDRYREEVVVPMETFSKEHVNNNVDLKRRLKDASTNYEIQLAKVLSLRSNHIIHLVEETAAAQGSGSGEMEGEGAGKKKALSGLAKTCQERVSDLREAKAKFARGRCTMAYFNTKMGLRKQKELLYRTAKGIEIQSGLFAKSVEYFTPYQAELPSLEGAVEDLDRKLDALQSRQKAEMDQITKKYSSDLDLITAKPPPSASKTNQEGEEEQKKKRQELEADGPNGALPMDGTVAAPDEHACEGWLWKKGASGGVLEGNTYQRFWVELRQNGKVFYYPEIETSRTRLSEKAIFLCNLNGEGSRVIPANKRSDPPFTFQLVRGDPAEDDVESCAQGSIFSGEWFTVASSTSGKKRKEVRYTLQAEDSLSYNTWLDVIRQFTV